MENKETNEELKSAEELLEKNVFIDEGDAPYYKEGILKAMEEYADQFKKQLKEKEEEIEKLKLSNFHLVNEHQKDIDGLKSEIKNSKDLCESLRERLNASSLLYKESLREVNDQISEKVDWFNSYNSIKAELTKSNEMNERLYNALETASFCIEYISEEDNNEIKTALEQYQNSKK